MKNSYTFVARKSLTLTVTVCGENDDADDELELIESEEVEGE